VDPDWESRPKTLVNDPAIFVIDFQDVTKIFLLITVLSEGTFTSFFKDKKS
jgi:hypothetical protein